MLPKTAEYALRTMACLAGDPERALSADQIAEQTVVPRRYLHKVLQDLVRAELVRSRSGPGGGYALALASKRISILDVVNAVSPLERIRQCPLGLKAHTTLCPLHRELDRAYAATERAFAGVTLEQLCKSGGKLAALCES